LRDADLPGRFHYWTANAHDFGQEVPNLAEDFRAISEVVIKQDQDVLEAIQTTIERICAVIMHPKTLWPRSSGGRGRRILNKMLEAESPVTATQ